MEVVVKSAGTRTVETCAEFDKPTQPSDFYRNAGTSSAGSGVATWDWSQSDSLLVAKESYCLATLANSGFLFTVCNGTKQ